MFRIGGLEAGGGWRMEEAEDRSGFTVSVILKYFSLKSTGKARILFTAT
jgi:hypothetical protein